MNKANIEIPYDFLPKKVQQLIELIGFVETESLVNYWKGEQFYLPSHAKETHELIINGIISLDSFDKLCSSYGDAPFYVPKCKKGLARYKIELTYSLIEQNKTLNAICRETGYSRNQIINFKHGMNKKAKTLFDNGFLLDLTD